MIKNTWRRLNYITKPLFRRPNKFVNKHSIQIRVDYIDGAIWYRIVPKAAGCTITIGETK